MAQVQFRSYTVEVNAIIKQNIENALNAVGLFVEGEAKRNIRNNRSVDTGMLLNNTSYDVDTTTGTVRIGNFMNYAVYIEKGTGIYAVDGNGRKTSWAYEVDGVLYWTKGQQAKPFLVPAIEDNIDVIKNIIIEHLREGM